MFVLCIGGKGKTKISKKKKKVTKFFGDDADGLCQKKKNESLEHKHREKKRCQFDISVANGDGYKENKREAILSSVSMIWSVAQTC